MGLILECFSSLNSARPQRQLPTPCFFLKSLYYRIGILSEVRLVGEGLKGMSVFLSTEENLRLRYTGRPNYAFFGHTRGLATLQHEWILEAYASFQGDHIRLEGALRFLRVG